MTTEINPKRKIPPNRLRTLREAVGWTMADVAEFIGVNESLVSMHERSRRALTSELLGRYTRLYRVEAVEVFHEVNEAGEVGAPENTDTEATTEEN